MGDFENFAPMPESAGEGGASGNEQANEKAREQMQEQFRQAQARAQQIKRDEKKAKGRDNALAKVISAFIQGDVDNQILNTVLSLLKQEISAEFILGLLALYYPNVQKAIYAEPKEQEYTHAEYNDQIVPTQIEDAQHMMEAKLLTMTLQPEVQPNIRREFNEHDLPEHVKKAINQWLQDMMYTAFLHPAWLLPRVFFREQINTTCIQLAAFVLERYLKNEGIEGDFEKVRTFSAYIVEGVIKRTYAHVYQSQNLSSPQ